MNPEEIKSKQTEESGQEEKEDIKVDETGQAIEEDKKKVESTEIQSADKTKQAESMGPKEEAPEKSKQGKKSKAGEAKKETPASDTQGAPQDKKAPVSPKIEKILNSIEQMTVLELSEMVKALEQKFGVTAGVTVAGGMAAGQPATAAAQPQEEKTTFDVFLEQVGDKKIQVIKEVRAVTSLGLKEAKELVDNAPKPIKVGVSKEEAEEMKKKIEAVGATVTLK